VVVNISVVAPTSAVSYTGGTYSQDFDSLLPSPIPTDRLTLPSASVLPQGWIVVEYGGTFGTVGGNAESSIQIDNGGSGTGDTFLYGATGSNERALGSFSSGSMTSQYGVAIVNNSGSTINNFTLSYRGEQWKNGRSGTAVTNKLTFDYSTTASSLSAASGFTSVTALDFTAPQGGTTGSDVTLDGNDAANQQAITSTVTVTVGEASVEKDTPSIAIASSFPASLISLQRRYRVAPAAQLIPVTVLVIAC
jgi:hypothetical protein